MKFYVLVEDEFSHLVGKWVLFWQKTEFCVLVGNEILGFDGKHVLCFGTKMNFCTLCRKNEFYIFSGKWFFILAEEWFFILMGKWVFSFHFWPNVTLSLPKITNQFYPSKPPRIKNSVRRLALMNWTHLRFLKIFYINQDGMRNTYCWSWPNAKSINRILINGKLVFHKEPNKSSKRFVRL